MKVKRGIMGITKSIDGLYIIEKQKVCLNKNGMVYKGYRAELSQNNIARYKAQII